MPDNAPTVVPTPAGPPLSAVEQASAAARAAIAAGTDPTAGKAEHGNVEDDAGRPVKLPTRSPTDTGRFAKDGKREVGEGAPNPRNVSLEGEESDDDDSSDGNDDGGTEESEVEGEAEGDIEGGADGEEGEGESEGDGSNVVVIPGRRPGTEFRLEVDDPETVERLRQLTNGYMAGDAVRAAHADIENKYSQLEEVQETLALDPAGFFIENMPKDAAIQAHTALVLLTQPEVWKAVAPRLARMVADPAALDTETTKVKVERYEMRDTLREAAAEQQEVRRNLQQIQGTLGQLMPTDLGETEQAAFWRDSMLELQRYAEAHDLNVIPVADMPVLLARVMQKHGINPIEAAARIGKGGTTSKMPKPGETKKSVASRPNGQQFVKGAERRKAAARVAPAGAGTPTTAAALTPPRKADGSAMSIAEMAAWHRSQVQKGRPLMTPGQRT